MATVQGKGYEEFCHQLYSNIIQEERQKILTFFEVERTVIEGLNIREDTKFIDILEQKAIISESNVDKLLEYFNKFGKKKLEEIVKVYKSAIETFTKSEEDDEEDDEETFTKSEEDDEEDDEDLLTCECHAQQDQERLLCLSCSKYICYNCFLAHRDHEVFSEDELDRVVENYQRRVQKELAEVQKMTESCKEDVDIVRMNSSVEEIQNEVSTFYKTLHTAMKKQLEIGKEEHAKAKRARDKAVTEANKYFGSLSILSSDVSKHVKESCGSPSLIYLQELHNLKDEISEGIEKAKSIGETVESVVQYCPAYLSARFATIMLGPILGAVRVNKRQVIIVTDQRLKDPPSIHLSCVSCDNTGDTYWSHVIDYSTIPNRVKKLPVISVCNSLQIKPPQMYMLIGCGSKIIRIEMLEPRDFCYYNSSTVEEVQGLPKGSDITCMKVIPSSTSPAGVLIIDSVSHSITRLDKELVHMETLSLGEKAYLAAGVFDKKQYTYAYYNGTVIKIINGNSPTNVIRVIHNPPGSHNSYPVDMFHDFAAFSVFWKNRYSPLHSNKLSKVVAYSSNGELKRVCHEQKEGSSEGIGISYVRNGGLLCLANGKVVLYDTLVKEHDGSSLLQSLLGHLE